MERAEVSLHEVSIFRVFKENPKTWLTHKDVATMGKLNERTVRAHTLRLVKLGMLDQAELFPRHRYRMSAKAGLRNKAYMQRLDEADEIFKQNPIQA